MGAAEIVMPGLGTEMLEIQLSHGIRGENQQFLPRRKIAERPPRPKDRHGTAEPGDVKLRHRV